MYFRRKTSAGRAYLQIVESRREGDQVRQQVIATLGRFEDLQASGQLERLLRSGARFAAKAMMLSAVADDAAITIAVRRVGPALGVVDDPRIDRPMALDCRQHHPAYFGQDSLVRPRRLADEMQ
jgi:hypothetical protein